MSETRSFLETLFGQVEGVSFHLWKSEGKTSHWFSDLEEAIRFAESNSETDLYAGAGLSNHPRSKDRRIKNSDADGMVALYSDIDYGEIHAKSSRLPKNADEAYKIIEKLPLKPNITVHSGHGFQCWWVFQEPWIFDNELERDEAIMLSRRWGMLIKNTANYLGWTVDSVYDLARVMRVPGSMNRKSEPFQRVKIHSIDPDLFFSIEDFIQFLPDDIKDDVQPIVGVELVVDPNAQPPAMWQDLIYNDPSILDIFLHKRNIGDGSTSEYDLSLASRVAQYNWTPQQICDLLVAHRVRHNGVDDEKLRREDYFMRTITKALSSKKDGTESGRVETAMAEINYIQAQKEEGAILVNSSKEALVNSVSNALGVKLTAIYKYAADSGNSEYTMEINGRPVAVGGVMALIDQRTLRRVIAESCSIYIRTWKEKDWSAIAQSLLDLVEEIDVGADATEIGLITTWVLAYTDQDKVNTDVSGALSMRQPVVVDGHYHIHNPSFLPFVKSHFGVTTTTRDLAVKMSKINAERVDISYRRKSGKSTSASFWKIPHNVVSVPEGINDRSD